MNARKTILSLCSGCKNWNTLEYCTVLMTNEMHNSYKKFIPQFCLFYMFRKNPVVHHQEHGIIYCITQYNVLMTNEMYNSYNQFLFHSFLSALHVSKESRHSSSGARHNILYYTVRYICTCTTVPNYVIQYFMLCSWWWRTRFVRNM